MILNKEKDFGNALYNIRYNYPNIVTTFGGCCVDGCKNTARGSGKCPDCSERDMAKIIGDRIAMKIHNAIKLQSHWINEAQDKIEEIENKIDCENCNDGF